MVDNQVVGLNMVQASHHRKIIMNSPHHQRSHIAKMSLSRCARGHTRSPIDSLCKVFGIPTYARNTAPSGASRWATQRLQTQARNLHSTVRPTPNRINEVLFIQARAFSRSRPHLIMKPTGRFKTMEQIKSRANLGVLKISYGQALFRGALITFSSLTCCA